MPVLCGRARPPIALLVEAAVARNRRCAYLLVRRTSAEIVGNVRLARRAGLSVTLLVKAIVARCLLSRATSKRSIVESVCAEVCPSCVGVLGLP